MSPKALKPGSLVLVSGVNGYVAGHVASQLLSLGYHVRGTVRDQAKLDIVTAAFKQHSGQFEGIIVPDMTTEGAFASVVKGADAVVHVASDLSFSPDPNVVITPVVNATNSVLAAAATEPNLKRFVYTSSVVAAALATSKRPVVDEKAWNEESIQAAWAPAPYEPERALTVYSASKAQAEQAAWKFVKEHKPSFVLNTVLPALCVGPKAFKGQNPSSSSWIQAVYTGDEAGIGMLQNLLPQWTVDVRDVARAHVAGLLEPDVEGRRLIASSAPVSFSLVVDTLKKIYPEKQDYPAPSGTEGKDPIQTDNSYTIEILNRQGRNGFTTLEESLRDQIPSY